MAFLGDVQLVGYNAQEHLQSGSPLTTAPSPQGAWQPYEFSPSSGGTQRVNYLDTGLVHPTAPGGPVPKGYRGDWWPDYYPPYVTYRYYYYLGKPHHQLVYRYYQKAWTWHVSKIQGFLENFVRNVLPAIAIIGGPAALVAAGVPAAGAGLSTATSSAGMIATGAVSSAASAAPAVAVSAAAPAVAAPAAIAPTAIAPTAIAPAAIAPAAVAPAVATAAPLTTGIVGTMTSYLPEIAAVAAPAAGIATQVMKTQAQQQQATQAQQQMAQAQQAQEIAGEIQDAVASGQGISEDLARRAAAVGIHVTPTAMGKPSTTPTEAGVIAGVPAGKLPYLIGGGIALAIVYYMFIEKKQ